ncbi:hypothetical protein [Vibrio phage phiKT1028]|nr:hypothetical protein [Vibrio phage phiKT1028]
MNTEAPVRWKGVEFWTYDPEREDDRREIRGLDIDNFIYCGMGEDTHEERVYLYLADEERRIPVVIWEYMGRASLERYLGCLAQVDRERIVVFVPNLIAFTVMLDDMNIPYQPCA